MSANRSPRLRARLPACCTVHSPAGVGGDAARMHPAAAVLDEHQEYIQPPQQHGVHVQEIDCDDPGSPGVQELPPARARAARRRIDARSPQDLPHGGRRDRHAELGQFAVDPAVSPQRILLRQADDQAGDTGDRRRAPWLAPPARVVLAVASLRCQASSVAGVTGKTSAQRLRGISRASAANPHPAGYGSYRTRPACRRSTEFSCRSTSSSASFARSSRNTRTARPRIRHVSR